MAQLKTFDLEDETIIVLEELAENEDRTQKAIVTRAIKLYKENSKKEVKTNETTTA